MIISVASGKGGTGKTTVAVNLASVLAKSRRVQFIDADVEEPNAAIFLKPDLTGSADVSVPVPVVDQAKCTLCGLCAQVCAYNALVVGKKGVLVLPQLCHGCGGCRLMCPEEAVEEHDRLVGVVEWGQAGPLDFAHGRLEVGQPLAPPVIKELKRRHLKERLVIIDSSPGTSCPMVTAVEGSDFCLLVTEPTPFGYSDLQLAVEVTRKLGVPAGVVINRSDVGDRRVDEYLARENLPLLASLPFDRKVAEVYARGESVAAALPQWGRRFARLADAVISIAGGAKGVKS